jgi:GH24 family phage-related lysozyme (muramidase)
MTVDPRKAIFDAARAAGASFKDRQAIALLDETLTALGVPQAGALLKPSKACVELIQRFESYAKERADGSVQAYPDPGTGGAPWTIGWGSTTDELDQPIKPGTIWTREHADMRFAEQLAEFGDEVVKLLGGADTSQNQFDALVSFAYNLGVGNLRQSTLLEKHKAGDFAGAAAEFGKWVKAAGKTLPGLVKRRAAEAALYAGRAA